MGDYRSGSYTDGKMQIVSYYDRSYSAPYASYSGAEQPPPPLALPPPPNQLKKGKSMGGSWGLKDPEFQRKKRVASYKVYSVEGKVKGSFRKSFRWLKDKYSQVVYGWS